MKRIIIFIVLVGIVFIYNSCTSRFLRLGIEDDSVILAEKRMDDILSVLQNEDKAAFEAMFSKNAKEEADDFNQGLDYIMNLVKEEHFTKWERNNSIIVDGSSGFGYNETEVKSWFHVYTDDNVKYIFFILEYTGNTDKNKVGIYSFRAVKALGKKTQEGSWQEMKIPGIYIPVYEDETQSSNFMNSYIMTTA